MEHNFDRSVSTSQDLNLVIEVLKKYLSSENFELKSFDIVPASDDHIGFLGEHWKINIDYVFNDESKNVSLFYKTLPKANHFQAEYTKKYGFWEKEIFVHSNVFNKYKKFDGLRQCMPQCYYSSGEDLVFEDLHLRGFRMRDLRKPMDLPHASAVIKSLATFHAGCFILEENESAKLNEPYRLEHGYKNNFAIGAFMKNPWYSNAVEQALEIAAMSERYGSKTIYYDKVSSKWLDLGIKAVELIQEPSKEYRNVVIHMDLWNNNIMFKYNESGKPIQCMLVDYQCCRISKPAAEITSFAYLCLNRKTRDKIFDELVDLYHEELGEILKESGLDINNILPLKDLRLTCEEYRLWGIFHSQILFQFLFMDEESKFAMSNNSNMFEKLAHGDRVETIKKSFAVNIDYKKRMLEIADEFIERYII